MQITIIYFNSGEYNNLKSTITVNLLRIFSMKLLWSNITYSQNDHNPWDLVPNNELTDYNFFVSYYLSREKRKSKFFIRFCSHNILRIIYFIKEFLIQLKRGLEKKTRNLLYSKTFSSNTCWKRLSLRKTCSFSLTECCQSIHYHM